MRDVTPGTSQHRRYKKVMFLSSVMVTYYCLVVYTESQLLIVHLTGEKQL